MPVRSRVDHTAAGAEPIELRRPVGQLRASTPSEVPAVLAEAEEAARRGRFAAGFVAYDAAPAFDPAFRIPPAARTRHERAAQDLAALPLAWFGIFAEAVPARPLGTGAPEARAARGPSTATAWECDSDAAAHAAGVAAIRDAIAAGDAYLVNHTTRF
ncbi:MAG: hypothetical protein ACRDXC_01350, partial [Acidimicrobiales bacterium]